MKKRGLWGLLAVTAVFIVILTGLFTLRMQGAAAFWLPQNLVDLSVGETKPSDAGKVNLNTASARELMLLPGIGEVLARRILEYRQTHGPFRELTELTNIEGISETLIEQIADYITLGGSNEDSGS